MRRATSRRWARLALALAASSPALAATGEAAAGSEPALAAASPDVRQLVTWSRATDDHHGLPFAVVDKAGAQVFVFDAAGALLGTSPVLLGLAKGDDSVPGIGDRPLAQIRPSERTTPAGRFVAEVGHNLHGNTVIWVDYNAAISMHAVVTSNPVEHRLDRLATPTVADNRISFGCINVPTAFFNDVVAPDFVAGKGIVYVLPEVKVAAAVFGYGGAE